MRESDVFCKLLCGPPPIVDIFKDESSRGSTGVMRLHFVLIAAVARRLASAQAGPGVPALGDPVQAWACDASSPRQTWLVETGEPFPHAHITSSKSCDSADSFCLVLDIASWSNDTGANVHMWLNDTGYTGVNEQWYFSGDGAIISRMNGHCLTVGSSISGSPATMQNCSDGSPLQTWQYNATTGLIALGAFSDVCLDAGSAPNCSVAPLNAFVYCDPDSPTESRIADLVPRILPQEFPSLLANRNTGIPRLGVPPIQFGEALHGTLTFCAATFTDNATGYTSSGCPTSFPHLLLQVGIPLCEKPLVIMLCH